MQLNNVAAARVGQCIRELGKLKGYTSSLVMLWKPGASYARIIEMEGGSIVEKLRINADHDDWQQLRVLQLPVPHGSEAEAGGDRTVETQTAATESRT